MVTVPQSGNTPVTRVAGMQDVSASRLAARDAVTARMLAAAARAGFARVDLPVIEATELFLRTAGEERVQQMFAFRARNRELCLRPEFTASVVRATVADGSPLPARVAYAGPVFRHEQPGANPGVVATTARQFTEFGVELMGARGAVADAEVIGTAFASLQAAGVARSTLVLGHVGVARAYLVARRLDERVRDWLVWSMERMRPDDPRGERMHPALAALLAEDARLPEATLANPPDRDTFLALLREAGISLDGNRRAPEEIAEGLMRKMARRGEHPDVRRALAFLRRLVTLRGAPDAVLPQLDALIAAEGLRDDETTRLREILALLPAYGIPTDAVTLDLSLGRGLTYYTGIVFEWVAPDGTHIGGGGRYDDLATRIGAVEPVPAVGFSLQVERVIGVLPERPAVPSAEIVLVRVGSGTPHAAARLVTRLRMLGWVAVLDVAGDMTDRRAIATAAPSADGAVIHWQPFVGAVREIAFDDDVAWPLPSHERLSGGSQ